MRAARRPPVRPENPKIWTSLTFSAHVLTLDPCTSVPAIIPCDEVPDDATRDLCLIGLHGGAGAVTRITAPGTPRAAASARGLPAVGAPTAPPCDRSSVLGVVISSVVRLATGVGLRPAVHRDRLAAPALSRPLAT